jgi:transposase
MEKGITYVGLDAHQTSTVAAVILPTGELLEDRFATSAEGVRRWVRRLKRRSKGPIVSCYEAGPTGYTLQRMLEGHEVECRVIAPSLIPHKPGDRIKTDRRDARKLVELLAADLLTEVHAPTPEQEAIRDLCRARTSVKGDQKRIQHRLSKFLLRRGIRWTTGRKMWTRAHREWLRGQRLPHEADQITLDDHLLGLEQIEGRLHRFDEQLDDWARQAPYAEAVGWLRCFRGIDTLTALSVAAEIHDWRRFPSPRALMAYLGMVPSESSSGGRFQRGGLTKAGNSRVRRLLIEAAWHYRHRPSVGDRLAKRREGQPAAVIALADRAQQRLHSRYTRLSGRGKAHNQVVSAVGRELVGFLWAAMQGAMTEAPTS